jgi:hypothetical protein
MGTRNQKKNKLLVNSYFNPLITLNTKFGHPNIRSYYEEVTPNYFGVNSGVYNNYLNSISFGTSFITSPKSANYGLLSIRNRMQQLFYTQVKIGDFNVNVYEDFLGFFTTKLPFADSRDRYYTGGGFMSYRLRLQDGLNRNWSNNINSIKISIFSEVYTGTSYPDRVEYPDEIIENKTFGKTNSKGRFLSSFKRRAKYAYEDQYQSLFNKGSAFLKLDVNWNEFQIPDNTYQAYQNVGLFIGCTNFQNSMFSQNAIHNSIADSKILIPFAMSGDSSNFVLKNDRLHHFPATINRSKNKLFFGATGNFNLR